MSIELVVLTLLVFIASAMGTFSGFGTSTIIVPVMLLFFRSGIRKWRMILWFAVPGVAASYLGAAMSLTVNEAILTRILGGFLLAYVLFIFFKSEWKLPEHNLIAGARWIIGTDRLN